MDGESHFEETIAALKKLEELRSARIGHAAKSSKSISPTG
jgi:hypothetical protein